MGNRISTNGYPQSPQAALKRLIAGNRRFVNGRTGDTHEGLAWRKRLTHGQRPFATILACSDSRVPVELLFDQGFGDLFTIRVAGNVIATDVIGSMQYAGRHLRTPLFLVLGHQACGAVATALEAIRGLGQEPRFIKALVKMIKPGLRNVDPRIPWTEQLDMAVEANVRWAMKQLAKLPEAKRALKDGHIELVGAVYSLDTGKVRILDA